MVHLGLWSMGAVVFLVTTLTMTRTRAALNTDCNVGRNALTNAFGVDIPRHCIDTKAWGKRCFYSFVPPNCEFDDSDPVPMVFDIHGLDSCPLTSAAVVGWRTRAQEECFVVVWPLGNTNDEYTLSPCFTVPGGITEEEVVDFEGNAVTGTTGDCCCLRPDAADDFDFQPHTVTQDTNVLRAMMDAAIVEFAKRAVVVDTHRVYMSGHSNGCITAMSMGVLHSNVVAAVCCLSGVLLTPVPLDYVPTPMWAVHGTADPIVTFFPSVFDNDNVFFPGALATMNRWSEANGCTASQETVFRDVSSNTTGTLFQETECTNQATVELLALDGVGHFPFRGVDVELDTTQLAWNFCSSHSLTDSFTPRDVNCVQARQATFSRDRKRKRKCQWITRRNVKQRRKRVCHNPDSDARTVCPISCGLCN